MARYRGPKQKKARRFKEAIFGPSKALERKPYGPGQHGRSRFNRKSEYAIQLEEKQKAKYTYGILERQFRNLFKKANQSKGVTGEVLLQLCESRLDNIVYRLGIASTRSAARQLVSHRHITVDGVLCNIPSRTIKPGEVIGVREKSKTISSIEHALSNNSSVYEWMSWNSDGMEGVFVSIPEREEIPENIKEQLIVELYSK